MLLAIETCVDDRLCSTGPFFAGERRQCIRDIPDLQIAIGYELIFRVPVSELFAGLRDEVVTDIEANLVRLEEQLGQRSLKDQNAQAIARKLTWLSERKNVHAESLS